MELCLHAVGAARQAGAAYADARIVSLRRQYLLTEDERVERVEDTESVGIGVRAIVDGGWGFAATNDLSRPAVEKAAYDAVKIARASTRAKAPDGIRWAAEDAHKDVFRTPIEKDPFEVSIEDKLGLLLKINERMRSVKGVSKAASYMLFKREHRFLANSEESEIESDVVTSDAFYKATAVDDKTAKDRYYEASPVNAGYEYIEKTPLLQEAVRVGEEAVMQLSAAPCPVGKLDLVLNPSHLSLTMHESIGHALELDRVLGMEESLAGSSFATIEKLGNFRYGSKLMNIVCDNVDPLLLASRGYDDDAVAGQKWHMIRDGILVDYQTGREVCHAIGATRSRGSCRADSWSSIPIVRQSNFYLEPGPEKMTPEELIQDVKHGILIDGRGSFSIDQKRQNFQFGGDCFWEIRDGKVRGMLKDVIYQAITPEFWGSLDGICDKRYYEPRGVLNCGKGDPMQISQMSHGVAPARFRKINVGGAGK